MEAPALLAVLEELGLPPYKAYRVRAHSPERREDARRGRFVVHAQSVELRPPVDWQQNFGSRSWEFSLHTFEFADVLLQAYCDTRDVVALDEALALALDWIVRNPRGGAGTSAFAWYDMAAGIRAPYLAFLLRAAAYERRIEAADAATLLSSLVAHGEFLADEANYARGHNHGLFQDEGLLLLADYLPFLDQAPAWAALGSRRAVETLKATVSWSEALHLEHSPAYHLSITNLVGRLCAQTSLRNAELTTMLGRLTDNAGWLVLPDGTIPEVGDTDHERAPAWAARAAGGKHGLKSFRESGVAVVRDGDTYLFVSAGYHAHAHKHADELSFVLFSDGRRIVGDAGRYGYYEDETDRIYARSSHAHNTLVVDGVSFDWEGQAAYGSGLLASGASTGWYAVAGFNPLLRAAGVEHRRTFLLKPRVILLVVDEVEADAEHAYTRFLHFGADLDVRNGGGALQLAAGAFTGTVVDWGTAPATRTVVRGQREPELRGWTFPSDRERVPVWTAQYEARARSATFAVGVGLRDERAEIEAVERDGDRVTVRLTLSARRLALAATRDDGRFSVSEVAL